MQERNPYSAPTAPVISADEHTRLPGDPAEFEYGGFWQRVGASLLDGLIMMPVTVRVANRRRRATHDFIAGTVVLRTD